MKKFINIALILVSASLLFACKPSNIKSNESAPEGVDLDEITVKKGDINETKFTLPETSKYVIPEDAETGVNGGPGAMETTAVDYSYYPEDKRPKDDDTESESENTLIIYYHVKDGKIVTDFDTKEECTAQSVIELLSYNLVIPEGVSVVSFDVNDRKAALSLSEFTPDNDLSVTAISNTFIDNFNLDELSLRIGSKDMGTFTFVK